MKSFAEWVKYLKIRTKPEVREAARILEANGQSFLVDFGTENAIPKATDIVLAKLEETGGRA